MKPDPISVRDVVTASLILVGLGLLVYGQFFVTKSGAYLFVAEEPTPKAELPEDADVVDFDDLTDAIQQKFEQRRADGATFVGSESQARDALPWGLHEIGYVRYEGAYYETGLTVAHPSISRSTVQLVGGVLLMIGAIGAGWNVLINRDREPV